MQGRKFPNAGETVEPVQGVSNKNLLKNPYNTLNEPIAKAGNRPWMITTDTRGNVFAKSIVEPNKGVTNNNLLKNPFNILEVPAGTKKVLSLQRIKDINNKLLPSYITENRGINEIMLQILTMIIDQPVKLITIHLLKILITKNAKEHGYQTQQKILDALNAFNQVMVAGRRIFKENVLSPDKIPERLRQFVDQYEADIKKIYGALQGSFPNIERDIQAGLAELGLLSNSLTRLFEYNNAIDPTNTLSQEQINSASFGASVSQVVQPLQGQPDIADQKNMEISPQEYTRLEGFVKAINPTAFENLLKTYNDVIDYIADNIADYPILGELFDLLAAYSSTLSKADLIAVQTNLLDFLKIQTNQDLLDRETQSLSLKEPSLGLKAMIFVRKFMTIQQPQTPSQASQSASQSASPSLSASQSASSASSSASSSPTLSPQLGLDDPNLITKLKDFMSKNKDTILLIKGHPQLPILTQVISLVQNIQLDPTTKQRNYDEIQRIMTDERARLEEELRISPQFDGNKGTIITFMANMVGFFFRGPAQVAEGRPKTYRRY
jgi:hypothetical protein